MSAPKILHLGFLAALATAWSVAAQPAALLPRVQGMFSQGGHTAVFASIGDSPAKLLTDKGQSIGAFTMLEANLTTGYVDFSDAGKTHRIWMNDAPVQTFTSTADHATVAIALPLRADIRHLAISSAVAKSPNADKCIQAALGYLLNDPNLTFEARQRTLQGILDGTRKVVVAGDEGVSEEDVRAGTFTAEEASRINRFKAMARAFEAPPAASKN